MSKFETGSVVWYYSPGFEDPVPYKYLSPYLYKRTQLRHSVAWIGDDNPHHTSLNDKYLYVSKLDAFTAKVEWLGLQEDELVTQLAHVKGARAQARQKVYKEFKEKYPNREEPDA